MDQFVVDLGPGPVDVAEGDEAILFGPGTQGEPTAQDWAELLGTINYEVVTSPRGRVIRTYRGDAAAGPKSLSDEETGRPRGRRSGARWLAGAAGLTAVGTAAGVSFARSMRRRVTVDDPTRTRISGSSTPTEASSSPPRTGFRWRCARSARETRP